MAINDAVDWRRDLGSGYRVALVQAGGVRPELEPPILYYRRSWGVWSPVHEADDPDAVAIDAIEVSGRDLRWQGAEF